MNLIFELPFYSPCVGGIIETIKLARAMNAQVRFQRRSTYVIPQLGIPYTVGDYTTFPQCDICITYSDNPYADKLTRLRQIGRVYVYFMSYGMSIANERNNALNPLISSLCTTKKIEQAIIKDGGKVERIGFTVSVDEMYDYGGVRPDNLAVYYHPMPSKNYKCAVDVADYLFDNNFIEKTLSFGTTENRNRFNHPKGKSEFIPNADREQIRNIFNNSQVFVMPSVSEGLNMTPIEATMCGCPSVIVDGAIDELFIDGVTCSISPSGNYFDVLNTTIELMSDRLARESYRANMEYLLSTDYTIENLVKNLKQVI